MKPLPLSWYTRDAESVARDLLGCVVVRDGPDVQVAARVVETEAYVGTHDAACHASRGRTARTEVMFGPAGRAYVYLVYGLHDMFNVVTGARGDAQAVLVRAAEPVAGVAARCDGPGRLARALGIDRSLDGHRLDRPPLRIAAGTPPRCVGVGPRVGVGFAGSWADAPLRFWDVDSTFVSRPPASAVGSRGARGSR